MKTITRYVWAIAALGGALIISGCATAHTTRTVRAVRSQHVGPVNDFAVVESSTDRELSPQEMAQLRSAVAKYLESQGLIERKGEYYVRVDFTAEKPGAPGEWVIVKLTNIPSSTYTLIAAYPAIGADDYYPTDYFYDYGYGYWDSSYGYYDPSSLYPGEYRRFGPLMPRRPGDHKPGNFQPGDRDDRPRGTHARDDGRRDRNDGAPNGDYRPRNAGYTPRPVDSDGGSRDRGPRDHTPRSFDSGGSRDHGPRDYTPPSSSGSSGGSSYSPPPSLPSPPPQNDSPSPSPRYERNDAETGNANDKAR